MANLNSNRIAVVQCSTPSIPIPTETDLYLKQRFQLHRYSDQVRCNPDAHYLYIDDILALLCDLIPIIYSEVKYYRTHKRRNLHHCHNKINTMVLRIATANREYSCLDGSGADFRSYLRKKKISHSQQYRHFIRCHPDHAASLSSPSERRMDHGPAEVWHRVKCLGMQQQQ